MAFARPNHELPLAAVRDLAADRIFEEAVLQPIDNEPFRRSSASRICPILARCNDGAAFNSTIVERSLLFFSSRQRAGTERLQHLP